MRIGKKFDARPGLEKLRTSNQCPGRNDPNGKVMALSCALHFVQHDPVFPPSTFSVWPAVACALTLNVQLQSRRTLKTIACFKCKRCWSRVDIDMVLKVKLFKWERA